MFQAALEVQTDGAIRGARVLMTATLMTAEGAVSVRIRDISVAGSQIWAESELPTDCDAVLKRGSFFAAARLTRSGDRTADLQFYRLLSDDEFAAAFHRNSQLVAVSA